MLFSTIAQPQMFLWMMLSGMAAAIWFEIVDGTRRLMQAGRLLSLFTDMVFALGLAVILILFFLWGNYAQFRLYALFASALGFALFYFALLKPVRRALGRLMKHISDFMAGLAKKRPFNIIFK